METYKNWLTEVLPNSANVYFKAIKSLEAKFKIDNIFDIDEKKFNEYFTDKVLKGLDDNSKSYLNKFKEFKGYERKNIKSIKKYRTELEAILYVIDFFVAKGYEILTCESENLGYDLLAKNNFHSLTLEVKGLTNSSNVILSNNEHIYLDRNLENHRICVVKILKNNKREMFCYKFNKMSSAWEDIEHNSKIEFQKYLSSQFKIKDI